MAYEGKVAVTVQDRTACALELLLGNRVLLVFVAVVAVRFIKSGEPEESRVVLMYGAYVIGGEAVGHIKHLTVIRDFAVAWGYKNEYYSYQKISYGW